MVVPPRDTGMLTLRLVNGCRFFRADSEVFRSKEFFMKVAAIAVFVAILSGCASPPVKHVLGTEGTSEENLAVAAIMTNEVRLLELDGIGPAPDADKGDFFLPPGAHRFVFNLRWIQQVCAGAICMPVVTNSDVQRSACITAEPKFIYHFYARSPGPNWVLRVSKRRVGESDGPDIDHSCR